MGRNLMLNNPNGPDSGGSKYLSASPSGISSSHSISSQAYQLLEEIAKRKEEIRDGKSSPPMAELHTTTEFETSLPQSAGSDNPHLCTPLDTGYTKALVSGPSSHIPGSSTNHRATNKDEGPVHFVNPSILSEPPSMPSSVEEDEDSEPGEAQDQQFVEVNIRQSLIDPDDPLLISFEMIQPWRMMRSSGAWLRGGDVNVRTFRQVASHSAASSPSPASEFDCTCAQCRTLKTLATPTTASPQSSTPDNVTSLSERQFSQPRDRFSPDNLPLRGVENTVDGAARFASSLCPILPESEVQSASTALEKHQLGEETCHYENSQGKASREHSAAPIDVLVNDQMQPGNPASNVRSNTVDDGLVKGDQPTRRGSVDSNKGLGGAIKIPSDPLIDSRGHCVSGEPPICGRPSFTEQLAKKSPLSSSSKQPLQNGNNNSGERVTATDEGKQVDRLKESKLTSRGQPWVRKFSSILERGRSGRSSPRVMSPQSNTSTQRQETMAKSHTWVCSDPRSVSPSQPDSSPVRPNIALFDGACDERAQSPGKSAANINKALPPSPLEIQKQLEASSRSKTSSIALGSSDPGSAVSTTTSNLSSLSCNSSRHHFRGIAQVLVHEGEHSNSTALSPVEEPLCDIEQPNFAESQEENDERLE